MGSCHASLFAQPCCVKSETNGETKEIKPPPTQQCQWPELSVTEKVTLAECAALGKDDQEGERERESKREREREREKGRERGGEREREREGERQRAREREGGREKERERESERERERET